MPEYLKALKSLTTLVSSKTSSLFFLCIRSVFPSEASQTASLQQISLQSGRNAIELTFPTLCSKQIRMTFLYLDPGDPQRRFDFMDLDLIARYLCMTKGPASSPR